MVNIGSQVSFRDEVTGREQTVSIVLPADADIAAGRVSVLTPIGAALIGLKAGRVDRLGDPRGRGAAADGAGGAARGLTSRRRRHRLIPAGSVGTSSGTKP